MPKDDSRMAAIVERDEDQASDAPVGYLKSELTLKNLANRNRFNYNRTALETTSSSPSRVEPMIKQMKMKREKITGKGAANILDLQNKMAHEEYGHLTAIQPELEPEKFGKRMPKESHDRTNDFLAHEGFDRIFERKHQKEFPDYFTLANDSSRQSAYHMSQSEKKPSKYNGGKMKVSIEYLKKMLGDEGLSENLGNMVKIVHAENIDIRSLNNLKRTLLDSKKIENNMLPL